MTDKELSGRNRLKEALKLSDKTYLDKYLPIEYDVKYSKKYLKYIERLKKRMKYPVYRYFNTVGKRVAGIAIAATILFGCSMTVSAVRKSVVEFITNVYEKIVECFFEDTDIEKAPCTIETVYTLGVIPEGYTIDQFVIKKNATKMIWMNPNEDRIVLSQGSLTGSFTFDVEESNYATIEHHGVKIVFVEKNGVKSYFWNSEEYEFSLTISSDISQEDIFALIDSITIYNQ